MHMHSDVCNSLKSFQSHTSVLTVEMVKNERIEEEKDSYKNTKALKKNAQLI